MKGANLKIKSKLNRRSIYQNIRQRICQCIHWHAHQRVRRLAAILLCTPVLLMTGVESVWGGGTVSEYFLKCNVTVRGTGEREAAGGESEEAFKKDGNSELEATPANAGEYLIPYEVFFVDDEDAGRRIFNCQRGEVQEGTRLEISFPERLLGKDGYIWEAVLKSPVVEQIYQAGTQKIYIAFQRREKIEKPGGDESEGEKKLKRWLELSADADRLITGREDSETGGTIFTAVVQDDTENNRRIKNLVSMIDDSEWHYFYLIGKNYMPLAQLIGTAFDAEYSAVTEDKFSAGSADYAVVKAGVKRRWDPAVCTHRWTAVDTIPNGCLTQGSGTVRCEKCMLEQTVLLPAQGHADKDGDSLCDRCGRRAFAQTVGDQIKTVLHTPLGDVRLKFTCLDEDFQGSGKMLYLADETLGAEITGICFEENSFDDSSFYNTSAVRQYLRRSFINDLSIGSALKEIPRPDTDGLTDEAALLSEREYEKYRDKITKGQQYFLRTAGSNEKNDGTVLAVGLDGGVTAVHAAGNRQFGVRPFILLERPNIDEAAEPAVWKTGDIQARQVEKKTYLFRCIDEDYSDNQATHRKAALFLCDSVIRSDIDSDESELRTFSFGLNNNYKKSEVRDWLTGAAADSLFSLEPVYTGVNTAYAGSTGEGMFEQMEVSCLKPHEIGFQLLDDRLFCLSVEEALNYRKELWRFNGSAENNPETQLSPYSGGYYLRTPAYAEDDSGIFRYSDQIYAVDLNQGNIHPVETDSTGIGLRPAFALPQSGG